MISPRLCWLLTLIALLVRSHTRHPRHLCTETTLSDGLLVDCHSTGLNAVPRRVNGAATELRLNRNALWELPNEMLSWLENLTSLDLSQNHIWRIDRRCLRGLHSLRMLNLNHNALVMGYGALPLGLFRDTGSLRVLTAVGYARHDGEYPTQTLLELADSLEVLSLSALTNLVVPAAFADFRHLRVLDFFGGRLAAVTRRMLDGVRASGIEVVGFRNIEGLATVDADAFSDFARLRAVSLTCNGDLAHELTVLALGRTVNTNVTTVVLDGIGHGSGFSRFYSENFCDGEFWRRVRRLSLRANRLFMVEVKKRWCLHNLADLVFSYNMPIIWQPATINDTGLSEASSLRLIDLSYMSVTGKMFDAKYCASECGALLYEPSTYFPVPPPVAPVSALALAPAPAGSLLTRIPASLTHIYLHHWRTTALPFVENHVHIVGGENIVYVNTSNSVILTNVEFGLSGLPNLQVWDLSHGLIAYIRASFFAEMPNLRALNLSHNALGTKGTDFVRLFASLHRLEDVNLARNQLKAIDRRAFANCTRLQRLVLRENILQDFQIEIGRLFNVSRIDLSGNQLATIDEPMMAKYERLEARHHLRLDVGDNPFECNCQPVGFVRWVQTTAVGLVRRAELHCLYDGRRVRVMDVPVEAYEAGCERGSVVALIAVPLCVLVVLLALMGVVARYHRWYITYHYSLCRARRHCHKDSEPNPCDTMVMYFMYARAEADWLAGDWIGRWVQDELLPRAETDWGLRLYIGPRDDLPGATKTDNFLYSFSISDKLLVCLTTELVRDPQLNNHFNLALASRKPLADYVFVVFDGARAHVRNRVLRRLLAPDSPVLYLEWRDDDDAAARRAFWATLKGALTANYMTGLC